MVYQGPSKACARCKQRHIKCDETRPSCRNCLKRQQPCPGYAPEPGIRFQDETISTIHQAQQRERRPLKRATSKDTTPIPTPVPEEPEAAALAFFFDNYATLGRGSQSSRGLFELIMPIYSSAAPSSAMPAATAAVALTLTSEWHGKTNEAPLARRHLGKALSLLRSSLNDPTLSLTDDTMMAVLLLKFHDMLVACKHLKEVPEDHVNGAIALIKHRGLASFRTDTSKRLLQYVRHTAVECAIQRRTALDLTSDLWRDPDSMLKTPSIDLDWIGVDLANLRATVEAQHVMQHCPETTILNEEEAVEVRYVQEHATTLANRLSQWADSSDRRWRPVHVSPSADMDPSIARTGLYDRTCHVYPSAQIATIWNLQRDYYLLVLELLLRCEALTGPIRGKPQLSAYATLFQNTVDDLCASIPFLLGNRTKPSAMDDFGLPSDIKFLKHPDDENPNVDHLEMDLYMNEEQRAKSLLAQGPWRLQDHLCNVIRFVTCDVGEAIGPLLRPGQIRWITEQIIRVLRIQRIEGKGKGKGKEVVAASEGSSVGIRGSPNTSPFVGTRFAMGASAGRSAVFGDEIQVELREDEEAEEEEEEGDIIERFIRTRIF